MEDDSIEEGRNRSVEPLAGVDGDDAKLWAVWRQDESGNRFEVSRGHCRAEAIALVAGFEARGHKQAYWVELEE
jgi:hypothetical protein